MQGKKKCYRQANRRTDDDGDHETTERCALGLGRGLIIIIIKPLIIPSPHPSHSVSVHGTL
jgi:hypothetical protein